MAVYYMLCRDGDGYILDVRDVNWDNTAISGASVLSDDLDTAPEIGGTYLGGSYSPPPAPTGEYLVGSWSGDGSLVGGTYEMTANHSNEATLTFTKCSLADDSPVGTGSEEYWVAVDGTSVSPSVGKIVLSDGVGTVSFTPSASQLGRSTIVLSPVAAGSPVPLSASFLAAI